jgi:hypothetical protein
MFGTDSGALSGRSILTAPVTQGIALARSALGWVLAAFQAVFWSGNLSNDRAVDPNVISTAI